MMMVIVIIIIIIIIYYYFVSIFFSEITYNVLTGTTYFFLLSLHA